jgi:hypothetical protein
MKIVKCEKIRFKNGLDFEKYSHSTNLYIQELLDFEKTIIFEIYST